MLVSHTRVDWEAFTQRTHTITHIGLYGWVARFTIFAKPIKDIGNHDELLKTSEIYRETFTSQNKMSAEGEGAVEADTEASATQAQTQEGGEAHE